MDMEKFIVDFEKQCNKTKRKVFSKGETITTYIRGRQQVCILLEGTADLIRCERSGDRIIVDHFSKNDVFGEVFYNITTNRELFVEAKQKCTVLFFVYDNIVTKCKQNCRFHKELVASFSELMLDKITLQNTRVELLSKRSIREKLITYFKMISSKNFTNSFTVPFSLTDLADYLCVDRSAMMRELKMLKEEGFIEKIGNKITMLSQ